MYYPFFKRLFDILFSAAALLILFPVFVFITFIFFITGQGSPFFLQERPGKDSRIFKLIKFRTMNNKSDEKGRLLSDAQRMTEWGKFLRSSSLDEIPQLINVLKGDMSLIGPRPLLVKYLDRYTPEQVKRHLVKPGITGWAQVNGRNNLSWEEKFEQDLYYVNNVRFLLDLRILLMTVKKVLQKEGISSNTSVTMEEFKGND